MPTSRPRPRRVALPLAAAALLVPVATACTSSGSSGGDQRLKVAMAFPPAQAMSPYGDDAVTLSRLAVVEGLTRLDRNGGAKPALAASWKRDGDRAWEFTVRENAVFQDGTKLDAAAVVRSLTAAQKASPKPRVLSDTTLTATAEGADTVRITTKDADPLLPQRLANPSLSVLSAAAYKGPKVNPAGHATGPFTLAEVNGAVSATLERNDAYWGGKAKAPGVDVKFVADGTARANALRTKDVDVAEYVPISRPRCSATVWSTSSPRPAPTDSPSTPNAASSPTRRCAPPPARPSTPRRWSTASTKGAPTPRRGCSAPASRGPPICAPPPPAARRPPPRPR